MVHPACCLVHRVSPLWAWAALLGSATAALGIAWISAERIGIERLHDTGTHKLDLYSASLESALAKYDYLPGVVGLRQEVVALLRSPAAPGLQQSVNLYLSEVNTEARSAVLYVLDTHGLTLAASNWNEEASFVGMDLSYRPYFHDAVEHGTGRFYGIGTTSGKPGFYYSQAIRDHDEVIGVAAVKVSLDHVEQAWSGGGDIALVVDASGVVFLASDPEWKFKTLGPLQPAAAAAIEKSRQYAGVRLAPLGLVVEAPAIDGARIVAVADGGSRRRYLELGHPTPEPTWRLILLSDYSPVNVLVRNTVAFTAVALAFVFLLFLYLHQRRRTIYASLAAKEALQRAHDELERKVAERTADLVAANEQLGREVAERQRAEHVLREAQDGLVQAGKMAVLGQMAAGITHELNQPLAALRTLSDNARLLLAKARTDDVQNNLTLISQLTDRMAKITGQLKAFARKSPLQLGPVSVRRALANVQALLEQRLRTDGVAIVEDWSEDDVEVHGRRQPAGTGARESHRQCTRCDAGERRASPRGVGARERGAGNRSPYATPGRASPPTCCLESSSRSSRPRSRARGLGSGLAISAGIIREFGGSLVAANRPQGGAEFTIELASAMETHDA